MRASWAHHEKGAILPPSLSVEPPRWLRNSGVESPKAEGGRVMQMSSSDLDRLGDEIAELSAHLDAATARLLDLIREFDARAGWHTGFRSCAAWLSWRVGFSPTAAREHVRVARPRHAAAARPGARPRRTLLRQGPRPDPRRDARDRGAAAGGGPRRYRRARRADRARLAAGGPAGRGSGSRPADDGPAAGRRARPARRDGSSSRDRSRHLGRALPGGGPRRRRVLADSDAPGQSVLEDGARVPAGTSQRLACDASRVVMRHDPDGRLLEVGARTRTIRPRYGGRCTIATAAVAFRAAASASARATTSATGPTAGPPRSRTSPCSVADTTALPPPGRPATARSPASARRDRRSRQGPPRAARRGGGFACTRTGKSAAPGLACPSLIDREHDGAGGGMQVQGGDLRMR